MFMYPSFTVLHCILIVMCVHALLIVMCVHALLIVMCVHALLIVMCVHALLIVMCVHALLIVMCVHALMDHSTGVYTVARSEICNIHFGLFPPFCWFGIMGYKFFSQFCMHVQLFSHADSRGCRAICMHPRDYSGFHLLQLYVDTVARSGLTSLSLR